MKKVYVSVITIITICCIIIGTILNFGEFKSDDVYDKEIELEEFNKIKVEADVTELEIRNGDEFKIAYKASKSLVPEYEVKNNTLYIKQKQESNFKLFGTSGCKWVVTVPENIVLEEINVKADITDLTIEEICSNKGTYDIDVGDVKIVDSDMKNIEMNIDIGDVDIDLENELDNYSMDLKVDLGEIEYDNEDYGTKYKNAGEDGNINITCDTGDIKITGR